MEVFAVDFFLFKPQFNFLGFHLTNYIGVNDGEKKEEKKKEINKCIKIKKTDEKILFILNFPFGG